VTYIGASRLPVHGFVTVRRPPKVPLQSRSKTPSFVPGERLIKENLQNMEEMKKVVEMLANKHGDWLKKFPEYNIENFTIMDQYGVVHNSPCQYIDSHGRSHATPQVYMSDSGIIHDTLELNKASSRHRCGYVGHNRHRCHRRSPSPIHYDAITLREDFECNNLMKQSVRRHG
jgi:hypothetical protein